jgi:hypothetical protein
MGALSIFLCGNITQGKRKAPQGRSGDHFEHQHLVFFLFISAFIVKKKAARP